MSFQSVEMEYRRHAERIHLKHRRRLISPSADPFMTCNEVAGIAYYLKTAEQVWNLQREKVIGGDRGLMQADQLADYENDVAFEKQVLQELEPR